MYADRTVRAKPNPVSLAAAIGINGGLVAALLLSSPDIREVVIPTIIGTNIPIAPPPPPEDQPQPPTDRRVETRDPVIVTPRPDVDVTVPTDNHTTGTIDPGPPVDLGPPSTGGGTGVTVDPPAPAPVLIDAAPARGVSFQPDYPPSERRDGNDGRVTVRVLVGADGRVKAVEQVSATSDAFFQATRRYALSRWRFTPATRDGVPQESWRTMTVRFVLEG
ncbi:energy transducer TonB [Sphingomonas sp.]|uniref:energy transducer TonB n=1 Tax=Sphingomonas sp. TaxID=28214 RepID=UPI002DD6ADDD|nr:TonB family protein [Sphingomonas sp.]